MTNDDTMLLDDFHPDSDLKTTGQNIDGNDTHQLNVAATQKEVS